MYHGEIGRAFSRHKQPAAICEPNWLYLTPVIWPLSFLDEVSGPIQTLVRLNPMYDIVCVYRSIFFGAPIILDQVVGAIIWSIAIGVIGVAAFVRHEGHIVRHL